MISFPERTGGVTAAQGFKAAGVPAGIKYQERRDVALLVSSVPCAAAGVFTTNQVAAAPVVLDRAKLAATGFCQAFVINSGCANACTGQQGLADAQAVTEAVAADLQIDPAHTWIASTGVIGALLPVDRMIAGAHAAAQCLSVEGGDDAAHAIMTTDTVDKQAAVTCVIDGQIITIGGMCKGAGMIEPMMATMLAFVTTDAAVDQAWLQEALTQAANMSFNRVVVDGDESTNDTLVLLANGVAGNQPLNATHPEAETFLAALKQLCLSLAKQIVMDGEGVSKFVTVSVSGAQSNEDAHTVARAIARSPLVKTSWFGVDPNWGRVICATGYAGVAVDPEKIRICYGPICAYDCGRVADQATLDQMKALMQARAFEVSVDLGSGSGFDQVYTCDLTFKYVEINAEYTT